MKNIQNKSLCQSSLSRVSHVGSHRAFDESRLGVRGNETGPSAYIVPRYACILHLSFSASVDYPPSAGGGGGAPLSDAFELAFELLADLRRWRRLWREKTMLLR